MRNNNNLSLINFKVKFLKFNTNNYYFALQSPSKLIQYNKIK